MSLTIGDFARLGGVSARMLRHYDRLGLLRPHRVDADTGYRYYRAAQLTRLNHLVALKDLGFTLEEVAVLLEAEPSLTQQHLQRRRAELASAIEADQRRLAAVDARLRLLGQVARAGTEFAFVQKPLSRLRLFQLTGQVEDAAELAHRVGPLFDTLTATLLGQHRRPVMPSCAWYDSSEDTLRFGVGFPAVGPVPQGVLPGDLPARPAALTVVHHGTVRDIGGTWQALAREADHRGRTACGAGREIYHAAPADRPQDWVVELQLPVR